MGQGEIARVVLAANFQRFYMVDVNRVRVQHHVYRSLTNETLPLLGSVKIHLQLLSLIRGQGVQV